MIFIENQYKYIRNIAKKNNWEKIGDMDFDQLKNIKGMGINRYLQLLSKITEDNEVEKIENRVENVKRLEIENIIRDKTKKIHFNKNQYIDSSQILNVLSFKCQNLDYYLNILKEQNKIYISSQGIRYNFKSVLDLLSNIPVERDREIIYERLQGKTYQKIAESITPQLTRQRVKQIIYRNYKNYIRYAEEDKYSYYYKKYKFYKEDFCKLFDENQSTYYYLKDNYKREEKSIENILKDEKSITNKD